jgi:hypothetical protein
LTTDSFHENLRKKERPTVATQTGTRVQLTQQELDQLIDREARKRLGISGQEFKRKYARRELPDVPAVRDIAMLLKLAA